MSASFGRVQTSLPMVSSAPSMAPISIAAVPPSVSDSTEPARFTVIAPAKINLALSVGPLRPDGFHELRTVFQAVDLYDTVTVQAAAELELAMSGTEAAGLPTDPSNLAWRASGSSWSSGSRWRPGWPAARPTLRRPWWPATGCGGWVKPMPS
jgi:hypothetical protein